MRFLTIIIFFYLWLPVNAESFYTGKELLKHCENCVNSVNASNVNACVHCISNISVMHDVFVDWGFMEPRWCLDSEVTFRELTKKTMRFIYDNPNSQSQYSTNLIANSLAENYPCNK